MTRQGFEDLVKTLSFEGGLKAWGTYVEMPRVRDTDSAFIEMQMHFVIPDRVTGHPCQLTNVVTWDTLSINRMDKETCLRLIHRAFAGWMLHELGESLLVDGERKWDPHHEEKRIRGAA